MQTTFAYRPVECVFPRLTQDTSGKIVVQANMPGAANAPCITCIGRSSFIETARYYTNHICITGPIVSSGDGELTVFHKCTISGANIPAAISVFALRTRKDTSHSIDQIISAASGRSGWVDLNLAKYTGTAKSTRAVLLDGTPCIVWLHSAEIEVGADFKEFSVSPEMMYTSSPKFTGSTDPVIEGLDETTTDSESTIYSCEYLPMDTDDNVQVYEVPTNSKIISQSKIGVASEIISTLTMVTVVFIFTFMAAPLLYPAIRSMAFKNPANDQITKEELNSNMVHIFSRLLMPHVSDANNKMLNITKLGTAITVAWMIISLACLIYGSATNTLPFILGGIYLLIIIVVAVISNTFFSVLQTKRTS